MAAYWGKRQKADHSSYNVNKYLIVNLVFSHLGLWIRDFFLIASFPDHCLLVTFFNLFHLRMVNLVKELTTLGDEEME